LNSNKKAEEATTIEEGGEVILASANESRLARREDGATNVQPQHPKPPETINNKKVKKTIIFEPRSSTAVRGKRTRGQAEGRGRDSTPEYKIVQGRQYPQI